MRGNSVFNGYTLQNNQLTIPLTNYSDVVKFCIIPSQEGNYAPNGFVEFTLDGKTIRQPIGTANFMAEGLNIVVPRLTTQNTIPIRGVATPLSLIKIYDNEELIGQTTALANGNWNIQCKLYEPYPFSIHNIYAEITTSQGLVLETVVEHVIHNISAIQVSKVTMYNTAHPSGSLELKEYVTEFDFLNPPEKGGVYWYWPNYPDFTFKIEFTNNDSTLVHNVLLNVLTSNGSIVSLPTVYDGTKQIWVATGDFYSNNLPVNVTVGYNTTEMCVECTNNPSNTNYVLKTSNISNELSTDNRYLPDFNPKDRNCNGASGKDIVNSIIVHSTFNNTYPNPPWNSFIDPFDIEEIVKIYKETGLYPHYIIGRDGVIYKLADVSKRAPHAGGAKGKPSKILCNTPCSEKVNDISVGIELVVLKDCAPGGIIRKGNVIVNDPVNDYHPTVAQITALTNLINEIRGGCPIKNLLSHQDVDGTRKTDPWGMNMNEYRNNMGWDKPFGCVPPPNYTCPVPASFVLDPSGFVYEAVPSNRLQGVTVGVYHKKQEEDMYGTITEKIVLWNAADYGQTNPQITNEYGEYAWDVPQDLWQVKYEKAGYETVYSNWLPVPPPQLDINIAMVQAVPPRVKKTQGYESGIEITFDKFMQPATMTTDFISVTRNGANVAGIINLLDAEINPANSSERFVSKVKFVPEDPFLTTDAVILTVKHTVRSYTGNEMDNDFVQQIAIQHEVNSLTATPTLNLALQEKGSIEVTATPAGASAGKKITARSVSSALATVTDNAVLDATGKAKLQVSAELPGSTQIIVTLDGTDINAIATVNIAMPAIVERVKIPIASIPSGSTVDKNATVTLSSNTAGATIYYTLNGSAPSAATGLKYTQPIVLTEDVTIKAVAVKEGMSDSEVAVFEYTVKSGNVITEVKGKPQEWMVVSPIPVRVGKPCKISFNLPDGNLKDYDIAVYSILGQRVYENRRLSPVIEIHGLHQGQYIVRMLNKNNGNHQTQKIFVVN